MPYALYAENTQLTAGPGILIEGNKISNTGDPDPADDLKTVHRLVVIYLEPYPILK